MQQGTEIVGRYILAFVESTGKVSPVFERKTRKMFAENDLDVDSISENSWHDALNYAKAMDQVKDEVGSKTITEAGIEQAKAVPWPDHIETVADGLQFIVEADRDAHRGGYEGGYVVEETGDHSARIGIKQGAPYPLENFKGVFLGAGRQLSDGSVDLSETSPRPDEQAAFELTW
jgi:hypothetical protein